MGGISFEVDEKVIGKVIGLSYDGNKYKNHNKMQDLENLNTFFKDNEKLVKKQSGFDSEAVLKCWDKVCLALMKYVTLECR